MEDTLRTILEVAGGLLTTVLGFFLGRKAERAAQSVAVKASLLETVRVWLTGVEKFVGILGDTLTSVSSGSPQPVLYSLEERRKSAQEMTERTNEVLGILRSQSLARGRTRHDATALAQLVDALDRSVKYELLPLDLEVMDRARDRKLDHEFATKVAAFKLGMDRRLQEAHQLVARIKSNLS